MTPATQSALLLLAAGLTHSFSLMCHKLPSERCPAFYPRHPLLRTIVNLVWLLLFVAGIRLAFLLATMLGFRNMKDYLETTEQNKGQKN